MRPFGSDEARISSDGRIAAEVQGRGGRRQSLAFWFTTTVGYLTLTYPFIMRMKTMSRDEMMWLDPAVRWLLGQGFTSGVWYVQSAEGFFAGNMPLFTWLGTAWMGLFGIELFTARLLPRLLLVAAVGVLWWAAGRRRLIPSVRWQALLAVLVMLSFGVENAARGAKPNALCMVLASTVFLGLTLSPGRRRIAVLLVAGALSPMAGLQLPLFLAIGGLGLLLFGNLRWLRPLVVLAIGGILGLAALLGLYASHGVLGAFFDSTIGVHVLHERAHGSAAATGYRDLSYWLILIWAILTSIWLWRTGRWRWRMPLNWGLFVALLTPPALLIASKYHAYYAWMGFAPLAVAMVITWSRDDLMRIAPRGLKVAGVALITAAILVGFPLRAAITLYQWPQRDYQAVVEYTSRHVQPEDRVFVNSAAYFPARRIASEVYGGLYIEAITDAELQSLTAIIAPPGQAERVAARTSREWTAVTEPLDLRPDVKGGWRGRLARLTSDDPYHLVVLRPAGQGPRPQNTKGIEVRNPL